MQFDRQIVLTATIFFIAFTTSTLLFVFFIRYVTYINDFSFDNNKVYAYAQLLSPSPLNKLGVKIVTPIKGQTFNVGEGAESNGIRDLLHITQLTIAMYQLL